LLDDIMVYGVMDRGIMMCGKIICLQSLLFNLKYKLVAYRMKFVILKFK